MDFREMKRLKRLQVSNNLSDGHNYTHLPGGDTQYRLEVFLGGGTASQVAPFCQSC